MMLSTLTQISVDGVVQGPGGEDEDRRGGFTRGGWAMGRPDPEVLAYIIETFEQADAFLLGRWTYDLWSRYWGAMEIGSNPIGDALNSKPKYVASRSLANPSWAGTTVLSGDIASAVMDLKSSTEGQVQVHGSVKLIGTLLEHALVDELNLLVVPVVVGDGARMFPGSGPRIDLELVASRAFPHGVVLQTHRPTGISA